jgi:hypothetical protein
MEGLADRPRGAIPEETAMERPEEPQPAPGRELSLAGGMNDRPMEREKDDPPKPSPSPVIEVVERPDDPEVKQPARTSEAVRDREEDPSRVSTSKVEIPIERQDGDPESEEALPGIPAPGHERGDVDEI